MKRMKVMGVALIAIFALSAVAASSAFAGVEVGRCEPQALGKYTSSSCTVKAASGKGTFEYHKGLGGKLGISASSGEATLVGASGTNVVCSASTTAGKYVETNGKVSSVAKVQSTFTGCGIPSFGLKCNTKGDPAETIVTAFLKGKMGYISGEKTPTPVVGQQLEPESKKAFAEFECGGGAVNIKTESEKGHNCIISELTPPNTMSKTISQVFETASGANQKYTHFEKTPTKICQLESSLNGGPRELSGQLLNATVESEVSSLVRAYPL